MMTSASADWSDAGTRSAMKSQPQLRPAIPYLQYAFIALGMVSEQIARRHEGGELQKPGFHSSAAKLFNLNGLNRNPAIGTRPSLLGGNLHHPLIQG
jgi:hypothetical protein